MGGSYSHLHMAKVDKTVLKKLKWMSFNKYFYYFSPYTKNQDHDLNMIYHMNQRYTDITTKFLELSE